jgi:hypothetical protein
MADGAQCAAQSATHLLEDWRYTMETLQRNGTTHEPLDLRGPALEFLILAELENKQMEKVGSGGRHADG